MQDGREEKPLVQVEGNGTSACGYGYCNGSGMEAHTSVGASSTRSKAVSMQNEDFAAVAF